MKGKASEELARAIALSRARAPSEDAVERMQATLARNGTSVRPRSRMYFLRAATYVAAVGAVIAAGVAVHRARSVSADASHDVVRVESRDIAPLAMTAASAPDIPSVAIEDLPRTPQTDRATARPIVHTTATTTDAADTELALVQRAQAALATDPTLALSVAEQHATAFPRGELTQERELIAIEALVKLERTSESDARAARFLTDHPRTPYRLRLQRAVGHAL